jgi:hypothetical protein
MNVLSVKECYIYGDPMYVLVNDRPLSDARMVFHVRHSILPRWNWDQFCYRYVYPDNLVYQLLTFEILGVRFRCSLSKTTINPHGKNKWKERQGHHERTGNNPAPKGTTI